MTTRADSRAPVRVVKQPVVAWLELLIGAYDATGSYIGGIKQCRADQERDTVVLLGAAP